MLISSPNINYKKPARDEVHFASQRRSLAVSVTPQPAFADIAGVFRDPKYHAALDSAPAEALRSLQSGSLARKRGIEAEQAKLESASLPELKEMAKKLEIKNIDRLKAHQLKRYIQTKLKEELEYIEQNAKRIDDIFAKRENPAPTHTDISPPASSSSQAADKLEPEKLSKKERERLKKKEKRASRATNSAENVSSSPANNPFQTTDRASSPARLFRLPEDDDELPSTDDFFKEWKK